MRPPGAVRAAIAGASSRNGFARMLATTISNVSVGSASTAVNVAADFVHAGVCNARLHSLRIDVRADDAARPSFAAAIARMPEPHP